MAWKKGQTGNAGGRPKKAPELREVEALARAASPEAIRKLTEWMRSDNAKASVSACNAILDRGFGKPAQAVSIDQTITHDLSNVSDAQLAAILAGAVGGGRDAAKKNDKAGLH